MKIIIDDVEYTEEELKQIINEWKFNLKTLNTLNHVKGVDCVSNKRLQTTYTNSPCKITYTGYDN